MPELETQCPVCSRAIAPESIVAHVNNCLDLTPENPQLEIPSPPPTDSDTDDDAPVQSTPPAKSFSPGERLPTTASTAPPEATPTPPPKAKSVGDTAVGTWLSGLGLSKYTPHLLRAGFRSLSDLLAARTPADVLREHGILALGARRKLTSELDSMRRQMTLSHDVTPVHPVKSLKTGDGKAKEHGKAEDDGKTKRKLWAIFEPGYRAIVPSKKPRTHPKRPAGRAGASGTNGNWTDRRKHRFSQRVPGTSFTVDSFKAVRSDPGCTTFFLTHFHADHYGGLRKTTLPAGSRVICSPVTARLVQSQLRVPAAFIQEVVSGHKVDFKDGEQGASVWFYDANHCPGAVVILFYVWRTKRWVVHSGDCRFDERVFGRHAKLAEVVKKGELDYMHLDTTYCNPRYVFPHQDAILASVVRCAREENARTRGRCLFFFGTYSIGKEKVFLAVAEALNLRIYAGKRKRSILETLQMSQLTSRLVDRACDARVHVVSMRSLSPEGLREYAVRNGLNKSFIGRGLAIVFRPTGWAFQPGGDGISKVCRGGDQAMIFEVAYSEHSSFQELVAFVKWAQPARVIPTVNARSKEQADDLRKLLGHTDRSFRGVT